MSTTNTLLFRGLHIVAWIIFIGLCIEAGGLIVNFVFSILKPEVVGNLYQKLDLNGIYNQSKLAFYSMYSFILVISLLKAYMFYIVVILMHKTDLSQPFSTFVSGKIIKISYCTFSIGILSYFARQTAKYLGKSGYDTDSLSRFWADSQAFILMAAVIYVIAAIFQRGVEIQNENELTV
jgi:hypothetical protein